MVEISVVIPTFNVEKYIEECLDSVINQTFDDIEIICIDDCSTDNTLEILEEYSLKDSRIRLYALDEHKTIGYVRNYSLTHAKGKYFYFLDSDDYLELDAFEKLYTLAEEKSLDVLMFCIRNFKDETNEEFNIPYTDMPYLDSIVGNQVFTFDDIKEFALTMCVILPAKLFKRELVQDIKFQYEYTIFEDNAFFLETMLKAKRMYFLREYLYNKRDRKNSIMTTYNERYFNFIDLMDVINDLAKRYNRYDELKPYLYQFHIHITYFMMMKLNFKMRCEYFKKMKKKFISIKDEVEDIREDIFLKYQLLYDSCIKSDSFLKFMVRLYYCYFFKSFKTSKIVFNETSLELKMWDRDSNSLALIIWELL